MFSFYNYLGFNNPYYIKKGGKFIFESTFEKAISHLEKRELDVSAIIEIFTSNHIFGDRTLIKGLKKTPWMSKPNQTNNDWLNFDLPEHGSKLINEKEAAKKLFLLLYDEIYEYIENNKKIGILLSGGMDSRIVAGVLSCVLEENNMHDREVVAISWGNKDSRDVVYAKEIAKRLGWKWKYFALDCNVLMDNIELTASLGCEFSPMHLHAMSKVRDLKNIDCILAGSFGDSVGRAEFSGKNLKQLESLNKRLINRYTLIRNSVFNATVEECHQDLENYYKVFPRDQKYQYYELEQELHYMRRMLNPCIGMINEKIPIFQVFSKPSVYEFMWSLDPEIRNDQIYCYILKEFTTTLNDIPWARTGLKYLDKEDSAPDSYNRENNSYGYLVNKDNFKYIKERVLSREIHDLNIFNMQALYLMLNANKLLNHEHSTWLDEKFLWIASLSIFIKKYEIVHNTEAKHSGLNIFENFISAPYQFFSEKFINKIMKKGKS